MELTHINKRGDAVMVDISDKSETKREAVAMGRVFMKNETVDVITRDEIKKGDVFAAARIAGIMAAKKTADLIPLCHNIALAGVSVEIEPSPGEGCVEIKATARCTYGTGVEMEALTAASVAALTIYDMCKAIDKSMTIGDIRLIKKTGGKSGDYIEGE